MTRMHEAHVAEVAGLVVAAGNRRVVDGAELQVGRGEVVALIGPSGSGKTTIAHSLLGHLRPGLTRVGGSVWVRGEDPFTARPHELRGRVVAYLGQDPGSALNPLRRVEDQLAEMVVRRRRAPSSRSDVATAVAELADMVALPSSGAFLRRFPHQLSGGQAQRAAIALSLAAQPDLLVLDEPTSGLDPLLTDSVLATLDDVFSSGTTAGVVISHDDDVARALADRVVAMAAGRVRAIGTPGEVLDRRGVQFATAGVNPSPERLTVRNLSAAFGPTEVVSDVSFEVGAGEALAVVGPSGSGKTTIARCVVGLHRPTAGTVKLDGVVLPPEARRRRPAQRRAIQLVAQDAVGALNPRETARVAIERPLRHLVGLSRPEASMTASKLLEQVRLEPAVVDRRPSTLSGGERQRVNLARALAARPEVLVCDEPTASLDPDVAFAVIELLDELRRDLGLAVVLISHDFRIVARAATRALVLDNGRIAEAGDVEQLIRAPTDRGTADLVAASPAFADFAQARPLQNSGK